MSKMFQYPSRRVVLPNATKLVEAERAKAEFQYPSRRVVLPNQMTVESRQGSAEDEFQYPSRRVVLPNLRSEWVSVWQLRKSFNTPVGG